MGCGSWLSPLWVVGCGLWVVGRRGYGSVVVVDRRGCGLWISVVVGCGLWVVDWRGCGLWVVDRRGWVVVVDRRAEVGRGRGSVAEGGRWSWIGG